MGFSLGVRWSAAIQDGYLIFCQDITVQEPLARARCPGPADPRPISEGIIQVQFPGVTKDQTRKQRDFGIGTVASSAFLRSSDCAEELTRIYSDSGQNLFCSVVAKSQVGGIHFHQPHLAQCPTRENSIVNKDEITTGRDAQTLKERKILNLHMVSRAKQIQR